MSLTMQENPRLGAPVPMTDAEWRARVQLAACYRVFDLLGWTEMIFNHITLRVPGPQRVFLINPFGLMYHEVTASNLVAVDIDGQPVRPTEHAVNRAGFVTHSAIHGNVDEAHCVMHTHTTSGMAVACLEQVLQAAADVLARNGIQPEYLALVDAETFLPIDALGAGPAVLAVAADLGGTRLIDNVLVEAVLIDPALIDPV